MAAGQPIPFTPHSTLPSRRLFFGRENDLESIARVLQPEHVGWGVVLDGPGGMGKTALAVEAAHRAPAEHYPLKLFITAKSLYLDPTGEREAKDHRVDDFYGMLSEIGRALGRDDIPRVAPEQRPDEVRHALAAHRALLVLDNLESFSPAERRRLYDLLEALPRTCRAIVTTRRRDDTAARTLRLDKLDADAANQLLDSMGEHAAPIAKLAVEDRQRLYAETGGNPLLLTWTAGQLGRTTGRCRTVEEAVARLQEAHRRQKVDEKNDPLEFIFGDLVATFAPDETAVLAALAHFTEPARVGWLLPLAKLSEIAALTALDGLRDRALLIEDDVADTWLLPPLAARFLRRRAPEAVGTAGERLAGEAYALAVQHGYADNAPFTKLEAAWPTVQAALPLLLAGDNARLQRVCDALSKFLDFTGRWDEQLSLCREAEARGVAAADLQSAGWRACQSGMFHGSRGEAEAVLVCAERSVAHWKAAGAGADEQATAIRLRGLGHTLQKHYPAAIAAYQEAIDLWRSLAPESEDVAIGLNSLANARLLSGDLDGAQADFREALRIARTLSYREGIATYTSNLADVFLDRRDWPAAERQATEGLELSTSIGWRELIAHCHYCLAKAMLHQQRAAEALPHAREAVAILARLRSSDLADAQAVLSECEAAGSSTTA